MPRTGCVFLFFGRFFSATPPESSARPPCSHVMLLTSSRVSPPLARSQLPMYVNDRPSLLEEFKMWDWANSKGKGRGARPVRAAGPETRRQSSPPDPDLLTPIDAWKFMQKVKGWGYSPRFGYVFDPEERAVEVLQEKVS